MVKLIFDEFALEKNTNAAKRNAKIIMSKNPAVINII